MVRTYNEYLKLLEAAVVGNGKRSLSDYQIEQFIKSNHLDSDWHIVLSEVKKDMATILKKYQNPVRNVPKPSTPTRKPGGGYNSGRNNSSVGKQVKSYDVYMRLLEDAMLKNSKAELSDAQIYQFLSANKLDSDWGITSVEIRKDMKTISAKFARQERTEALRQKHSTAAAEPKSVNTASNAHRNEKKKSIEFIKELVNLGHLDAAIYFYKNKATF